MARREVRKPGTTPGVSRTGGSGPGYTGNGAMRTDGIVETQVQRLNRHFEDVWTNKAPHSDRWRDTAHYISATRLQSSGHEANQGRKTGANTKLLRETATRDLNFLQSGLLHSIANPATTWFGLEPSNPSLSDFRPAMEWFEEVRDSGLRVLDQSNFYKELGEVIRDGAMIGTGAFIALPDREDLVRFRSFPIDSYSIAQDATGRVDTFCRELSMSLRQVMAEFGTENLSPRLKMQAERNENLEQQVIIRHSIWPNSERKVGRIGPEGFPFVEYYWEHVNVGRGRDSRDPGGPRQGTAGPNTKPLRVGGYHEFPVFVLRWGKNADDVFATRCPGYEALGTIKRLQAMVRAYMNALEKNVEPPLVGSHDARQTPVSLRAGSYTHDTVQGASGRKIEPLHIPAINMEHLAAEIAQAEEDIHESFLRPVVALFFNNFDVDMTATEARIRQRDQFTLLAPLLENMADDLLDPVIERVTAMMVRASEPEWATGGDGLIPMPPPFLQGEGWRPRYKSEVALAQKRIGITALQEHAAFVGQLEQVFPGQGAVDKLKLDQLVEQHANAMGVPADLTRDDSEAARLRKQREEAMAARQAMESAPGMAKAAKDLSDAEPGTDSVLSRLTGGRV